MNEFFRELGRLSALSLDPHTAKATPDTAAYIDVLSAVASFDKAVRSGLKSFGGRELREAVHKLGKTAQLNLSAYHVPSEGLYIYAEVVDTTCLTPGHGAHDKGSEKGSPIKSVIAHVPESLWISGEQLFKEADIENAFKGYRTPRQMQVLGQLTSIFQVIHIAPLLTDISDGRENVTCWPILQGDSVVFIDPRHATPA